MPKATVMADIRLTLRDLEKPLPRICMVCGRESSYVTFKSFGWRSVPLSAPAVSKIFRRSNITLFQSEVIKVPIPLCQDHKFHEHNRIFAILCGLFPALATAFVAVFFVPYLWIPFIAMGVFVIWVGFCIAHRTNAIHATEITEREITLTGVAPEFVDAMLQADNRARAQAYELPPGFRFVDDPSIIGDPPIPHAAAKESDANIQDKPPKSQPPDVAIRE